MKYFWLVSIVLKGASEMKMQTYVIRGGDQVKGLVNSKGWLEWKHQDGTQGVSRPGTFTKVLKGE